MGQPSHARAASAARRAASGIAVLLAVLGNAQADPIKSWPAEGIAVTTAAGIQGATVAIGDPGGGAIFVWEDSRDRPGSDLYGQRLNASGVSQWQADGTLLVGVPNSAERAPGATSDGAGGVVFTWEDSRGTQRDIYAQRVDANGIAQWQQNGVAISTACWPGGGCFNQKRSPRIVSDGAGGAIITWYELRDGLHASVWAQRVSADGVALWALDGVPVAAGTFHADFPEIAADGSGGAIIAWQDSRNGGYRIYVQRLNGDGVGQWPENGVELSPAIASRGLDGHELIADGAGGTIVAWVDGRAGLDADIYAQKVDASGSPLWQAGGIPVVTRAGHQYSPVMVTDAAGGTLIAWEDQGAAFPLQSIVAQRVSALGVPLWAADGVLLCPTCHSFSPTIVADGTGGAIVVWDESLSGPRIVAQRLDAEGNAQWSTGGFEVHAQPDGNYGLEAKSTSDGTGGVIIHWIDYRFDTAHTGAVKDIFAQRLVDGGGAPPTVALTASLAGAGSGVVSSTPLGISCGTTCSASFNEGLVVTLRASPDPGSSFAGWSGEACSGIGDCLVTMNAATSVTATFNPGTTNVRVPADFPTIRGAVSAAAAGHLILVAPGTYVDNIDFLGKAITVASEGGPAVTVIDGDLLDSVVTFRSGEGRQSVLTGFTLRRGRATVDNGTGEGGGVLIDHSSPTVVGNVIENNEACGGGGGVAVAFGAPLIQGNTIRNNGRKQGCSGSGGGGILVRGHETGAPAAIIAGNVISDNAAWDGQFAGSGGGIYINAGGPLVIRDNLISGNTAGGAFPCAQGGGIFSGNRSDPLIVQNVIVGNSAGCGGGVYWLVTSSNPGPLLVNNTIADNDGPGGSGIYADGFDAQVRLLNNIVVANADQTAVYCGDSGSPGFPDFGSNNVFSAAASAYGGTCTSQTGIDGNVSSNPLFVDPAARDYRLRAGSPSADAGDNSAPQLTAVDFDGNARITDGNADGSFLIDAGAYERAGATRPRRLDFTADGRSDILWRNAASGENYLYPMDGTTILGTEGYLRTVADLDWNVVGIGDFDGDGKADVLWRNASSGENYVYFMDGTAIANEGYLRTVADQDWQVAGIGDFDGDGKDDVVWRNGASGENYVYFMDGVAIKPSEGYLRTVADRSWNIVGTGDFDGDGKADIAWRNSATGENYLYPMAGLSIKANEGYLRTVADQSWKVAGTGDFGGDGRADILWRNASTGENYLYPMDGTAILATEGYLRTVSDPDWKVQATGDYDGDGKADILWRHEANGQNYLYPMEGAAIKASEGYLRTVQDLNWNVAAGASPF